MTGLLAAIRFLTRLPAPQAGKADFSKAMRWFPLVGLLVGGIILGGAAAGATLGPGVGAALALALWVWVTGALHLDGLADIADALGAGHGNKSRLQDVLHDPHVGSFAIVAVALLLIVKFALLQALLAAGHFLPLLLVPAAARFLPLLWARLVPSAHSGLASRFAVGWPALLFWGGAFVALLSFWPAFSLMLVFAPLWGWWTQSRLGGISGDSHGAGIEVGEALLLLALLVGGRF